MQKLSVRNGCMFWCAWLPPTFATLPGSQGVWAVGGVVELIGRRREQVTDRVARRRTGVAVPLKTWVWAGISAIESVWACSPPRSPQRVPAAGVDWRTPPQVGQRKVGPAVSTEGRAEQREQRLILVDRQELTIAQRPALRRETRTT